MPSWFIFSLVTVVLWGFWGFFPKLASGLIDPKSALFWEAVGSVLVGIVMLFILKFKPETNPRGAIFAGITGVFGLLGALAFFYALSKGKASVVVTITALYPIAVILLSYFFLNEVISIKQITGMGFALVAMVLLA